VKSKIEVILDATYSGHKLKNKRLEIAITAKNIRIVGMERRVLRFAPIVVKYASKGPAIEVTRIARRPDAKAIKTRPMSAIRRVGRAFSFSTRQVMKGRKNMDVATLGRVNFK